MRASLSLLEALLYQIPHAVLLSRPEVNTDMQVASDTERPYAFVCTFYHTNPIITVPPSVGIYTLPFGSAFESLTALSVAFGQTLIQAKGNLALLRELYSQSLGLIGRLIGGLSSPVTTAWEPRRWLSVALDTLHEVISIRFSEVFVDTIIPRMRTLRSWIK